jgi:uncharacterized glyoxalase superfamily protein PhnB
MKFNRMMTNVCSENLARSCDFYTSLFGLTINFESDWFVHLISEDTHVELGIILATHEVTPRSVKGRAAGVYLTFVVDHVDAFHQFALEHGYTVIQAPEDTFYGQRRMLVQAPEGTVVDVSSPIQHAMA